MAAGPADPGLLKEIEAQIERDLPAAEARLRALAEAHAGDPQVWLLLASLCLRRSGFDDMRVAALAALALAPGDPRPHYLLAAAQIYLGDLGSAAGTLGALPDALANWEALCRLAACQHRLGRLEAAVASYRRALTLVPRARHWIAAIPRAGLMAALRDLGRGDEADAEARAVRSLYRQAPLLISSALVGFFNRLDFHEWDRFRKKQGLCEAIAAYRRDRGAEAFDFHPRTYIMPRDRPALLRDAAAAPAGAVWIAKPTALFGGQGMRLLDDPERLAEEEGEGVIVQDYVAEPWLVQERKAHLRLHLLVTSAAPLRAWLWHDGIVRFAPEPYRRGPGWLERQDMHITNTALHKDHPGLVLSDDPEAEDSGHVWSLRAYLRQVAEAGGDVERLWGDLERLALGFLRVVEHSGLFARQAAAPAPRAYPVKLVGLDVLLDAGLRPWLLEAQRMPGQTGTPLIGAINGRLYRTIAEMTVAPLGAAPRETWPAREAAREDAKRGEFRRLLSAPR